MLKITFAATALLALAASSGASAYSVRPGDSAAPYHWTSDGGLGRYCPAGQFPHTWPNGDGVRCEIADGVFSGQSFN